MKKLINKSLLLLLVFSTVGFAGVLLEPWEMQNDMQVASEAIGAATYGGYIYAFGGNGTVWGIDTVQKYNPATDTWTQVAPMPTRRHSLDCAVVDGYIYAIGGHVSNSRSENERYDPSTDTWQSMAPKPTAVSGLGVAAYNGKIYTFGGNNYGSIRSVIEVYDPQTDSWQSAGNMPQTAQPWRAATLGDKIYLAGGSYNGTTIDHIWAYDPITGTWDTSLPGLNIARSCHELVVINDCLVVIGGGNSQDGTLNSVEWWKPGMTSWVLDEPLNVCRSQLGAEVVGNKIFAFGGYGGYDDNMLSSTEYTILIPEPATILLLTLGGLALRRFGR